MSIPIFRSKLTPKPENVDPYGPSIRMMREM